MEPRIQYAKTKDGVSIAFATYGDGRPVVWAQQPLISHVQLEWQQPSFRAAYTGIANFGMLVRYDGRGTGLSDRDVDDVSLEARVRDLEAVADHLQLNSFVLLGLEGGGLAAIVYAASYPERVSHLVLVNCSPRGVDSAATPRGRAFRSLAETDDWEMLTESMGAAAFGYSRAETKGYGEFIRAGINPAMLRRINEANEDIDVSSLLPKIPVPTLVVRHSGMKWLTMDATRKLAAAIPNSRLLVIEGLYLDNMAQLFSGVLEFLGEGEEAGPPGLAADDVHTILFTDVEGSTALTQRLGDAKARDLLREHERMVREALKAHGGSEVKTMGDGFMTSFSSATKALECAIAMQRAFAEHNESAQEPIKVRIGLNAGEPIAEDDDLFGTAVNLAARICAHAEAGQILAPIVVRELAAGKQFMFADLGETELRGFEDPVRLYELRWREAG